MNQTKTPCIGICSTTSFGDKICRGCKRFAYEVINWNSFSESEKSAVMDRVEHLTNQIMEDKFRIVSVQKLEQVMCDFRFFYDPNLSAYCWLHNLLQKHSHRISDLDMLGVELTTQYADKDIRDVLALINDELIVLSEAHFERYFQRV
jgi:uncharacterized protein